MIDDKSTAIGNAKGTTLADKKKISLASIKVSKPLPTKSSMYFHKNCMISTNKAIKKVSTNGPKKERTNKISIFFKILGFVVCK